MKDRVWTDVPGAPGVRLFPFIRKPDVVCSNSYIIDAPDQIIVIDPGADPVQMDEIIRQLGMLARPDHQHVSFYLTHCHVDHCFIVMKGRGSGLPGHADLFGHAEGIKALRDFNGDVTQARIMGWDFPPVELQVKLGSLLSGEIPDNGILAQPTRMMELGTTDDMSMGCQKVPLGNGIDMTVYHTPGHSPDSVCYQIGRFLFTGDLLFATDLGLVGIIGWDRDAMERSIRNVRWLLGQERIELCLPGHGYCHETEKVEPMLDRMLSEVKGMVGVKTKDAERIQFTSSYALDLLDEANDNFSIIAGRLYYLAYHLEDLEEGSEARKYMDMLEHDRIDEMLTSFNRFVEEFHAGRKLQLEVTMKAVQTMKSINSIFKGSDLEAVLDRSLISGTSRLLIDFMNAVKGIDLDVQNAECDPNQLINDVLEDQRVRPDDNLLDCLDNPDRYASVLAKRIAHIPIFDDIEIAFEGNGSKVMLDHHRFQDAFSGALLDLAGADVKRISVHLNGTEIGIKADISLSSTMGDKKVRALARRFELAGASFTIIDDEPWECRISCDPARDQ